MKMSTQLLMPPQFYKDDNKKTTGTSPTVTSNANNFNNPFAAKHFFTEPTTHLPFFSTLYESYRTRDVTDNKTSDTTGPTLTFKDSISMRTMNDVLCSESERLKTFADWPLTFIDKHILAQTGMYYLGMNDNVKCYFCEVEIGKWEFEDNPITEHMRWSPNCPLLRRRSTNNIPLDSEALDKILPPQSYDICGRSEIIDIRPTAYAETSAVESTSVTVSTSSSSSSSNSFVYPDHPEYAIESARLRSFAEWPRTMKQKPKELSEAGFFYTGTGDRVKCFSCGGGLKDWDESDDPWEQHALWLSNCPYLTLIKGKQYIDSVIQKYKTQPSTNAAGNKDNEMKEISSSIAEQQQHYGENGETIIVENVLIEGKTVKNNKIENSEDDEKPITDSKLCKICYARDYDTAFLPCGHVVACARCASSVTKCPMCRKPFTDVVRVYFS